MLGMLFLTDTMTITAQNVAVKTNVLYWTTATFNASVETRLSSKWTLDVSAGYNPFTFSDNKKLKHFAFSLRHAIGSVLLFRGIL